MPSPSRRRAAAAVTILLGLTLAACASPEQPGQGGWLVDRTGELGIDLQHHSGERGERWLPMVMGSGVAVFDADGDEDLDIYFANGNDWGPDADAPPADGPVNTFYRQNGGRFEDATSVSGLGDPHYGQGLAVGDVDNDGDLDLYLANLGPDQLYLNDGDGRFENATASAGIDVGGDSSSAVMCDFDRDGWLDIFVTRYVDLDPSVVCRQESGEPDYCSPQVFDGLPDVLLRNDGGGRFQDASALLEAPRRAAHGLGVVCEDLDGDGWLDFLVANDGVANHAWLNRQGAGLEESASRIGLAMDSWGRPEAGMGVIVADLDGDGRDDAFMTHLYGQKNTFYQGLDGDRGFRDAGGNRDLTKPSIPFTGFGVVPIDLELDSDLDLVVTNGRVSSDRPGLPGAPQDPPWRDLAEPDQVYRSLGEGGFEMLPTALCPSCAEPRVGRGLARGDIDGDGDEDLVLTHVEGPAMVLVNESPRRGRWLRVRAYDPALRRDAIGARVTLRLGGRELARSVSTGLGYRSASEPVVTFGLPDDLEPESLEVLWPDGLAERFDLPCLDCTIQLERGAGSALR